MYALIEQRRFPRLGAGVTTSLAIIGDPWLPISLSLVERRPLTPYQTDRS